MGLDGLGDGGLGYPTSREFAGGKPGSRGNHFEKGEIYWSAATGARIVWGQILETWVANNYENGPYGLPTSDEYDFQGGKRQDFQGGSIVWLPGGYAEDWEGDDDVNPNFFTACETDTSCAVDSQGSGDVPAATIPVSLPPMIPAVANRSTAPMSPEAQKFAEEEPPMPTCDELDARLNSGTERQPADTVTWCVTMAPPTVAPLTESATPSELPQTSLPPDTQPSETMAPTETSSPSPSQQSGPSSTTIPPSETQATRTPAQTSRQTQPPTPLLPTRTAAATQTPDDDSSPSVDATFVSTPPGVPSFCEESAQDPTGTGDWHGRTNYGCIYQFPVTFEAKTSPTNVVGSVTCQWPT